MQVNSWEVPFTTFNLLRQQQALIWVKESTRTHKVRILSEGLSQISVSYIDHGLQRYTSQLTSSNVSRAKDFAIITRTTSDGSSRSISRYLGAWDMRDEGRDVMVWNGSHYTTGQLHYGAGLRLCVEQLYNLC